MRFNGQSTSTTGRLRGQALTGSRGRDLLASEMFTVSTTPRTINIGNGEILADNGNLYAINTQLHVSTAAYANDSAAATGGIPVGGVYPDATGVLHVRLT